MCLIVNSELKTAKKPIIVYKVLGKGMESACRGFRYKRGITYTASLSKIRKIGDSVYVGIHACIDSKKARTMYVVFKTDKAYKFIIPVGAKYYLGCSGDIVSNMIYFPEIKKPTRR